MTTTTNVTRVIDARAMPCPGPLMSLIGAIREGAIGDVIEVRSSDAGSRSDVPAWLNKAGHELVVVIEEDGYARFVVRRRDRTRSRGWRGRRMTNGPGPCGPGPSHVPVPRALRASRLVR